MEDILIAKLPVFDLLLIITLIGLAWSALTAKDIFKAVVLFISFGMMMALAWLRLYAVDIALAEAAIGAGLTGAIFIMAIKRISGDDSPDKNRQKKGIETSG